MSIYCIGDLHGRYDLFSMLLKKINFTPQTDKLYLLGDVIDWNYGGIQIIDFVMQHKESCVLLQGNHEDFFLYMTQAYDAVMYHPGIKQAVQAAVEVYSEELFSTVYEAFARKLSAKNRESFYKSPAIKKWLNTGAPHVRQKILDAMVDVAVSINFDRDKLAQIKWILCNLRGRYKTKPFVQELLEQSTEHYDEIKQYVHGCPDRIDFDYLGKQYCLLHWKGSINKDAPYFLEHPQANTSNVTYLFGHDPVPMLHRKIQRNYNSFSFNYRRIFSWLDANGNRYYNLDLSSNPIAALRIDDMSEYYVGIPSSKKKAAMWEVPEDVFPSSGIEYEWVEVARLENATFENAAIISRDHGCQEFVIGISSYSRCIHYARISWLDYRHGFVIKDWPENPSVADIIEKVREDFKAQCNTPDGMHIEQLLHGAERQ